MNYTVNANPAVKKILDTVKATAWVTANIPAIP